MVDCGNTYAGQMLGAADGGGGGILGPYADYRAAIAAAGGHVDADVARVSTGVGAGLFEFVGNIAKPSGGTHALNWLLPGNVAPLVRAGRFLEDGFSNPIHIASANGGGVDTAATITSKWTKAVSGGVGDITDDAGDIKFSISGGDFSTTLQIPWSLSVGGPNPVLILFEMRGTYLVDGRSGAGGYVHVGDNFADLSLTISTTMAGALNRLGFGFSTGTLLNQNGNASRIGFYNTGSVNLTGNFAPIMCRMPFKFQPSNFIFADGSTPDNRIIAYELGQGPGNWLGAPFQTHCSIKPEEMSVSTAALDRITVGLGTQSALKQMWLRRLAAIELGVP